MTNAVSRGNEAHSRHMWKLKYLACTYAYGISRTIPQVWNRKKEYKNLDNYDRNMKPMPFMEKVGIGASRMIVAPLMWPFFMYNDASRLEFYLKGVNPRAYGIDFDSDYF